jgi:predicted dehydrogenase
MQRDPVTPGSAPQHRVEPPPHQIINVALVGYGYWGPKLARCVLANGRARLSAICDARPERTALASAIHGGVPVFSDVEAVLRDPSIDAVILATPPATHADLGLRALAHGKHVLVEKPLAGNVTDAVAMAQASKQFDRLLMIDHTYLFSPALETIRALMIDRRLGPVRYYHSIRTNGFGPEHETNVLWDLAVHDLSILDVLMPAPPSMVEATGLCPAGVEQHSLVQMTLNYPGRAVASVFVSWVAPVKVRTVTLGFDRHTICWDDLVSGSTVRLFDRGLAAVRVAEDLRQPHSVVETVPVPAVEPLSNGVGHFFESIGRDTPLRSGAEAGVRVVRLLEAAARSLARNGEPVPVAAAESGRVRTFA